MADAPAELPIDPTAAAMPAMESAAPVVDDETSRLSAHEQTLLRIEVPVCVTLASQRKSIQDITELTPGAIIKFDKTCDEPLHLVVGDRAIATGEAVKVGDKFGIRISGLVR
jgi:flagellar motor switch protein FliN/FliY